MPPVASVFDRIDTFDWDSWRSNMSGLREYFWSARVLQWAPLAGAVAVARRSLPACGLLAGWLFAFVLVKGSSPVATVDSGSFFRLLMPAFPAFIVLVAAVPLLVPGLFRRLGEDIAPVATAPLGRRALVALAVVLAALPVGAVAVAQPVDGPERAIIVDEILVPVDSEAMGLRVEVTNGGNRLTWDEPTGLARLFYRVYRTQRPGGRRRAVRGARRDQVRSRDGRPRHDTGEELPRPRRPGMGLVPNRCRCQLGGRSGPGRRLPPQRARPGAVRARLAERWPEAAAGGLALAGGLLYMRALDTRTNYDEGLYLGSLDAMRHGLRLGGDLYVVQPPGFYWLLQAVAAPFGDSIEGIRLGFVLVALAGLLAAFACASRLYGAAAGLAAAALLVVGPPYPTVAPTIAADVPSLALGMIALALVAIAVEDGAHRAWAVAGGAVLVFAISVKFLALPYAVPFVAIALAARAGRRVLLPAAVGGAAVALAMLVANLGALDEL